MVRVTSDRYVDGGPQPGVADAHHEIRFTDLEGGIYGSKNSHGVNDSSEWRRIKSTTPPDLLHFRASKFARDYSYGQMWKQSG